MSTYNQAAARYAANVSQPATVATDGQCFRYGKPIGQLTNLELRAVWTRAWDTPDTSQLDELRPEMQRRNLPH